MSQIKKGALLNYVSIFLTNVIGLVLTPFIIKSLGDAEYGIYTTIGALIGTFSVLDFGLNNTIIRFVAKYQAEKNVKEEQNFLAITMIMYLIISCIVLLVGFGIYFNLDHYFTAMSNEEIQLAKTLFLILIFNIAIGLPGGAFTGICLGYENFTFPKSLSIFRYILRSLMVVGLLFLGGKSLSIVILDSVFNVLIILITFYYVNYKLHVKIKLHSFERKYVKKIFSYSVWIFIYSIVAQFQWKAGHIALGNISAPEVLSIYAVGLMLGGYYGAFSSAITSVFVPRATQMIVSGASSESLTHEMIKIGRISLFVLMFILGAFVLYGKQFISLWVGDNYNLSWTIALLIMLAYTIPLAQGFTGPLIEAKNKVAFKSITYLIFLLLGTLLGYFMALNHGAMGMIAGTIIGWVIAQNIMNVFYHKTLDLNILRFFKETFSRILPSQILIMLVGFPIMLIPGSGWLNFILKIGLYGVVYLSVMYFLAVNNYEKGLIAQLIQKIPK
ncbi:Membrane protein involved in the export of O-antigen and teichoic acid [Flagellimonas taeanensis]|uniref:Membrane protein involved in the export of O-antigen and teichoic acid n=1 Tax=Flagellimonas taeanensis TaxID=1005926 RepID=A0A1M6V311_9FLAO|nr:oligosaccharide flippase family protein [Allomuricauda taeanensis]SFC21055.1 Membrane protein involved in the export of O-antigen and teichoic acid [Allomuricauda taeanensis]SHK75833.1 Membrane protein involved in the export of O-antigen and teichoic acid [Allomuricauda taeanensis]